MEQGTIEYPVSTSYRSEWGEWEAVREITQNAVDTGTKATLKLSGLDLIISDRGEGMELSDLLIGESSKDGIKSIGKFGEGLKFALLTLLREGHDISCHTGPWVFTPTLGEKFGRKILVIDYKEGQKIQGTRIRISDMNRDYRERFLSLNRDQCMVEKPLLGPNQKGRLFVKGIYVKDMDTAAGYNLNMERENPLSGDVDMWTVGNRIASIMRSSKNSKYINLVVEAISGGQSVRESEVGSCMFNENTKLGAPNTWRDAVKKHMGKVCRLTDATVSANAQYRGYIPVPNNTPILHSIVPTDLQVCRTTKNGCTRESVKDLDPKYRSNFRWTRRIIEGVRGPIAKVELVRFEDGKTQGAARMGNCIKIDISVVEGNREHLLHVMMHEAVHYYTGYSDVTPEFESELTKLGAAIVMKLIRAAEGTL